MGNFNIESGLDRHVSSEIDNEINNKGMEEFICNAKITKKKLLRARDINGQFYSATKLLNDIITIDPTIRGALEEYGVKPDHLDYILRTYRLTNTRPSIEQSVENITKGLK